MDPNLSPLDQLIAARIKVRLAANSRRADLTDINDYQEALRALKSIDPLLGGLKTTTAKYEALVKKSLDEFATAVDKIPTDLEKLGVNPKSIQRYHTQLVNLIKVAKKGNPLRAYSTYVSDSPIGKAQNVALSLAKAAVKSSGAGTKVLKPALVQHYIVQNIGNPLEEVRSTCDDWYNAADSLATKIHHLISDASIHEEPYSSGFTLTPEYVEYAAAQRAFSKQNEDLITTIRHNVIGLPLAASGFEDCEDPVLCIDTATKAFDEAIKLHMEFGKEWGDFRAKNQAQQSGQMSLFARAIKQQMNPQV
jgi:hypothetical protein